MEDDDLYPRPQTTISSWIVSLAISVVCCSTLFVVFAGYLNDIKRNIASETTRLEQMALRQEQLLTEIRALHHVPGFVTASPSPQVPSPPVAVTPTASAPLVPAANIAPESSAPPLAPTQVPAVPPVTSPALQAPVPPTPATVPAASIPEQISPQPITPTATPADNGLSIPAVSVPSLPPVKQ